MVQIAICDDENEAVIQHEDIVKMSGMTGMERSGKIKLYLPNVKIIFITGGEYS